MTQHWDHSYDVVVVGSGAAGFAAALTARLRGLSALIVEKTDLYGGSTALSGGAIWVPDNFHLHDAGLPDSRERARRYLAATVGDRVPGERLDAYLEHGPRMVREFHDRTLVRFMYTDGYSDYYPERDGGFARGRSVEPQLFDVKKLPREQRGTLRRSLLPTRGLTMTSYDFRYLNMVSRTGRARARALRVGARSVLARLSGQELLSLGGALIARMRYSLDRLGGELWLRCPVTELVKEGERVAGVRVRRGGRTVSVAARGGVVLASGGFSHSAALRDKHLPHPTDTAWSVAAEGQTGDGLELALAEGAATDLLDKVWGAPAVLPPGAPTPFFLVADRAIPGMIIVNQVGERYANEASPYHEFVDAMYAHHRPDASTVPSWLILDAVSKARYLFAGLFPGQSLPQEWLASGFAHRADTVEELARAAGMPQRALRSTVERFNAFARRGVDDDFGRGESAYDRYYGDPTLPNPNLHPLEKGPFYAIPVHPGDIGTKGGVVTDPAARVLREDGSVVRGLYASGNVSAAVMGETYPGPGATIGPAMTFSWAAVNRIAEDLGDAG
ncbi:FAD-dependent oxidoreductase [Streptomyces sp. SID14478]|uniref:FAD-dependent oxidoreductase n=1 Tax=Streptomyces sp. SID14478 TaxID=2706073 RepID=UPI0013DD320C|nr:FAD-dependent oxidoreductase [Streptomyces sp. SID14478]NEB75585.1 FAD-dependent oxidoreductase [Streptomyces sp. SID14478]